MSTMEEHLAPINEQSQICFINCEHGGETFILEDQFPTHISSSTQNKDKNTFPEDIRNDNGEIHGKNLTPPILETDSATVFDKDLESQSHPEVCSNLKPFCCNECGKSFKYKSTIRKHLLTTHNDKRRPFGCNKCGLKFEHKKSSILHMSFCQRREEAPFECNECGKSFKDKKAIRKNLYNVLFTCSKCGLKFKCKNTLQKHLFCIHGQERPFCCLECGSLFKRREHIQRHVFRVHLVGEWLTHNQTGGNALKQKCCVDQKRTLNCKECNLEFTKKTYLESHVFKIHSSRVRELVGNRIHWNESGCKQHLKYKADGSLKPKENGMEWKGKQDGHDKNGILNDPLQQNKVEQRVRVTRSGKKLADEDQIEFQQFTSVHQNKVEQKVCSTRSGKLADKDQTEFQQFTSVHHKKDHSENPDTSNSQELQEISPHLHSGPVVDGVEKAAFRCEQCLGTFRLRMKLQQHSKKKHSNRHHPSDLTISCDDSGFDERLACELRKGTRSVPDKAIKNLAITKFGRVHKQHPVLHKHDQRASCPSCFQLFEEDKELAAHAQTCPKYTLHVKKEREKLREVEPQRREYGCGICGSVLLDKERMSAHLLEVHKRNFWFHLCKPCPCEEETPFTICH